MSSIGNSWLQYPNFYAMLLRQLIFPLKYTDNRYKKGLKCRILFRLLKLFPIYEYLTTQDFLT